MYVFPVVIMSRFYVEMSDGRPRGGDGLALVA